MRKDSDFWDIGSIGAPMTDEEMNALTSELIVIMEDEPIHTDSHPFCSDPTCACRYDALLLQEYVYGPMEQGILTKAEAARLRWNKQV